jgi:membrane associated rhomboid family serine protease
MSAATIILAITVIVSAIGLSSPRFIEQTVLRPYAIARGSRYETLITSGFVHANLAHLALNLITFYSFAYLLERTIGSAQFVILYFAGMLLSGVMTCIKRRNDPNYAALGASGAILAVLFAAILYYPTQRLFILPLPIPIPAPLFALCYLGFSYFASERGNTGPTMWGRTNHDAHIAGALTGVLFVLVTNPGQFRALLSAI